MYSTDWYTTLPKGLNILVFIMVIWYGLKIIYLKIVQLLIYIFYTLKLFILYIGSIVRTEEFSNRFSQNHIIVLHIFTEN